MNFDTHPHSDLSKSVLAGVFAGIAAAVLNLVFIVLYRYATSYYLSNAIDITTTVFGSLILLVAAGVVFYLCIHFIKGGSNVYRLIVVIITAVLVYIGLYYRDLFGADIPFAFRRLFIGTQAIIGLLAGLLIPYLFNHEKLIS
jgi:hypothetical protein